MPERTLVASRHSQFSRIRKSILPLLTISLVLSLGAAVGCSNLPLPKLGDTPLPLPSGQAALAKKIDDRIQEKVDNEDRESVDAEYSLNDFLPPVTQAKLQPNAKIIGVYEKADMPELKLRATASQPPAPAIALAAHQTAFPDGQGSVHQHDATCDCLKEKVLPKLAKVEPIDPETFFASTPTSARPDTTSASAKRAPSPPLRSLSPQTPAASVTRPNAIRLTARPKVATIVDAVPQSTVAVPETANRAQMLIPIDPAVLKKFKADSARLAQVEAEAFAKTMGDQAEQKSRGIVVDPKMRLPDPAVLAATAAEAIQPFVSGEGSAAKRASPEAIRVSTKPFESLRSTPVQLPRRLAESPASAKLLSAKTFSEKPTQCDAPGCSGDTPCQCPQGKSCNCEAGKCHCGSTAIAASDVLPVSQVPVIKAATARSGQTAFAKIENLDRYSPAPPRSTKQVAARQIATNQTGNGFQALPANKPLEPKHNAAINSPFELSDQTATAEFLASQVEELPGLTELPDMAAIEKSLADFDKANTFDPTSIDSTDSVDPGLLKAKLHAAEIAQRQPARARFAQRSEPSESEVLLAKQLASQQSTLKELQSAITGLSSKTAPVAESARPRFKIDNAAFCTRIEGFGQFTPFASNTFDSRQQTLLYCEIENQTSNQFSDSGGTDQFETVLRGSVDIFNAKGEVVQSKAFPQIKDIARQRRRDFYVYFPVALNDLPSGDYRLELSIEDALGQHTAKLAPAIRFSVK